jgi:hypothetical protein
MEEWMRMVASVDDGAVDAIARRPGPILQALYLIL